MGTRWVVFDVIGVLVDINDIVTDVLHRFYPHYDYHELRKRYDIYAEGKGYEEFFRDKEREILKYLVVSEEGRYVLEKLKGDGYMTGIITNLPSRWGRYVVGQIKDHVDVHVISGEAGVRKPNPLIYKAFLKLSGARPEEVIFIDDRENNLITAKEIGMKTLLRLKTDVTGTVRRLMEIYHYLK